MTDRVLIIAEAGVNHNGDLDLARRLIDAAAAAGTDVVKFQTFSADRIVTRTARKADYQARTTDGAESQYDMLRKLELTDAMHEALVAHCAARNVEFLSTGFDVPSVDLLVRLEQRRFKIPSGEITNLPYLRHVGRIGKEVILSSGMSTMDEVAAAIDALEKAGTPRANMVVLHCTTEYPAPFEDVNLRAMLSIRDAFGVRVGYSDHTSGIEVAIAAAALGACVIEKHLTLHRDLPGPDHKASLEPHELKSMVAAIRNIERALGDGVKRAMPSELGNRVAARKSLVASRAIKAGERFAVDNVSVKRPGSGISPMRWDEIMGRAAARDFAPDEMLEL